jgi:hypothetical protein
VIGKIVAFPDGLVKENEIIDLMEMLMTRGMVRAKIEWPIKRRRPPGLYLSFVTLMTASRQGSLPASATALSMGAEIAVSAALAVRPETRT